MTRQHKILIVEDDPDTAEMLGAYFEAQGYQVMTAAWGNDALSLCQEAVPDLIIQDIRLPDMDGYQVVRKLHRNLRTSTVPIIFLTEMKAQDSKMKGLELGAVDYLTKPFDMAELRLRVRNALRRANYASLVSPVTGLPGEEVAEEQLKALLERERWAVIRASIVEIETFSETYGFVVGDDVLRAVGLIVSNVVNETGTLDDFVGHLGKADFLIVTQQDRAETIVENVAGRLERAFNYFYPVSDIESGAVSPMRAEIGLVTAASGPFGSPSSILEAAMQSRLTVATVQSART
jgi:PleD family two-component response regulator